MIIPKSVFVAGNATVIGDVKIGEASSIWFGAVVRGDQNSIEIGSFTNVQDNSVLHVSKELPLRVGNTVTIGHGSIIHGCIIGDSVLVGMGSIIMNGTTIGSNSIVGAGALVTEGKNIPERSLVMGFPSKVVRELRDDEVEAIGRSAKIYVELAEDYLKRG